MTTKIRLALAVTLAFCVAPSAMAHSRTYHAHTHHMAHPYGYGSAYRYGTGYQWWQSPGYGTALPPYNPYREWDCVTDEGEGRFLPCEMGGG